MAACRVCAAVAGVYSGIAIATVAGGLATPAASQAFWASVLAASGSGVASAASLRLERSCYSRRVPTTTMSDLQSSL